MRGNKRRSSLPREPQLLEIDKLSHDGRGIARLDGRIVFVEGALPGELVEAVLTDARSSFAEARTTTILRPSPSRVTPVCRYFHTCGGCSLQHCAPTVQLAFKEEVLHERLMHATGHCGYRRLPVLSGPDLGYRRKARLAVKHVPGKGKVLVGFRERHSAFITDMDACSVLDPQAARLLPLLSDLIGRMQARASIPQIELAVGDLTADRNNCALVFRHLQVLASSDLALLGAFGIEHQLDVYLQSGGPDTVRLLQPSGGEERLFLALPDFGLNLAFHPLDFTQVNATINRQMLLQAIALLAPEPDDRVLDLFCGLGNFTLPLATCAGTVVGVEGSRAMTERGAENAQRNGIANVAFHCADLTLPPERHAWLREGFDRVLLDPPRSGALEVLPAVIAARPRSIVYVSCNPATLARDAAFLQERGYELQAAGAMDMFPHTSHVEAMALFQPSPRRN